MAELMSSVRQALDDGGCDQLASARVLNLLEQDAVGRDLENLRIMIELARSEKSLAATQQALAAKEAEAASLSAKAEELEQANRDNLPLIRRMARGAALSPLLPTRTRAFALRLYRAAVYADAI